MTAPLAWWSSPQTGGPLAGVRVLDLSELLPGPFLTQSLAELGADVIRIERPPGGDRLRTLSPALFAAVNRGKRACLMDLKDADQRDELLRLAERADVLVESYRPGVLARLGLGPEQLLRRQPRLIVASLSGYGASGSRARWPGHDVNYLAASGALALADLAQGGPSLPLPVADLGAAVYGLAAIHAALYQRERTGCGQHLDIAITDCMAHWMNPRVAAFRQAGADTLDAQRRQLQRPAYGAYTCRDGRQLALAALEDHFWLALTTVLDLRPYGDAAYHRLAARQAVVAGINARIGLALAQLDRDEAMHRLVAADVPVHEVLLPVEAATHPPFVERGLHTATDHGPLCRFPVRLQGMAEPVPSTTALSR